MVVVRVAYFARVRYVRPLSLERLVSILPPPLLHTPHPFPRASRPRSHYPATAVLVRGRVRPSREQLRAQRCHPQEKRRMRMMRRARERLSCGTAMAPPPSLSGEGPPQSRTAARPTMPSAREQPPCCRGPQGYDHRGDSVRQVQCGHTPTSAIPTAPRMALEVGWSRGGGPTQEDDEGSRCRRKQQSAGCHQFIARCPS